MKALALIAAACAAQPAPDTVFKTDVSLVRLEVSALANGRPVEGLGPADFAITDNGRREPVHQLAAITGPLDIILLVDVSGSMSRRGASLQSATEAVLAALRPGDRLSVVAFNTKSRVVTPFSTDAAAIREAILKHVIQEERRGGTRILSAVKDAADLYLGTPRNGVARVILAVTDNMGFRSVSKRTVLRSLWEADATVSAVITRNAADKVLTTYRRIGAPYMALLEAGIDGVARETGGEMMPLNGTIEASCAELLERLRRRYLVFYKLPAGAKCGETRKTSLGLSNESRRRGDLVVRVRRGYVVPCAAP